MINNVTKNEAIHRFTRGNLLTRLDFNISINKDSDILDFCKRLKGKIDNMTDLEWEQMREYLPFTIAYSSTDEMPDETD